MSKAPNRNETSDHEQRVLKVMDRLQEGRICTPRQCPDCRARAEEIVDALADEPQPDPRRSDPGVRQWG